jgi:deoxyguanosine kinase
MQPRYIAIEGPIGVGKTSLAERLAERFNARTVLEAVAENPFLEGFYTDPKKHAFQTQIFFLLSRYRQQADLAQQELFAQSTVSDYLFSKDRIFAYATLTPDELALYEKVYALLRPRVVKPDLVVYLQARTDVLVKRIKRRGKGFERVVRPDYLEQVSRSYTEFFYHYDETPLLVVNTSDIDFVENESDLDELGRAISSMRGGREYYVPLGAG